MNYFPMLFKPISQIFMSEFDREVSKSDKILFVPRIELEFYQMIRPRGNSLTT
jgi:hypothetical protein